MEMATQTKKTKTIPTEVSSSTTTTAKSEASATGNGNPYTQNIKTVKKLFSDKINCYRESTRATTKTTTHTFYEIQNNKTENKISKYKQRNYLKFLINLLYLKLILCISQINKSILKLILKTTTTTKTNNNNNNNNNKTENKSNYNYNFVSENCIINKTQQQEQENQMQLKIAKCFKTISFKFKIVINFLIQFNYCRRKNIEKYVKILLKKILHNKKIIKHFVGICPKRLISLKRLKQIPENPDKVEEKTLCLKAGNYHYAKENVMPEIDRELQLKREIKLSHQITKSFQMKELFKESFKEVLCLKDNQNIITSLEIKPETTSQDNCLNSRNKIIYQSRHFKQTHITSARKEFKIYRNPYTTFKLLSEYQAELKAENGSKENNTGNFNKIKKGLRKEYGELVVNSTLKCSQQIHPKVQTICAESSPQVKEFKLQRDLQYSQKKCASLNKYRAAFDYSIREQDLKLHSENKSVLKIQKNIKDFKEKCRPLIRQRELKLQKFIQHSPKNCCQFKTSKIVPELNLNNKGHIKTDLELRTEYKTLLELKETLDFSTREKATKFALELNDGKELFQYRNKKNSQLSPLKDASQENSQGFSQTNPKSSKQSSEKVDTYSNSTQNSPKNFNELNHKRELANHIKSAQQFLLMHNNNNSSENSRHLKNKESKQQKYLKKCQHFLYSILLYKTCCCFWHIYGFPLVLVKILKYFKDSTVHVLTRRLKTSSTKTTTLTTATSIDYNYSNVIAACCEKLKKPTKITDYKANQQNVLKTHTHKDTSRQTTTFNTCAYSTSFSSSSSLCCSTTSLTASPPTNRPSPGNLILLLNHQPHKKGPPYCHYQQHHHQHHQQNRQQSSQLLRHSQQQQHHQQYNSIATAIHLQLPSLLVFSRTLIILILLSSLWHTSEGFHGSGVKLSTNTVKTKYGLVRGIVVRSSPSLVEAYLGIPYASPPVGSLRFMPPITPSTWKNVRNADRFSPVCPQNVPIPPNGPEALLEVPRARLAQLRRLLPLLSNQSEDCLYLNIYVPYENRRHRRFTTNSGESNDSTKLPTILFIHGESYEWNSGNPYDGSELAAHGNVIVVTINFRLGILGFLKTGGKESAQGNFGLMDLVAGLHWLKENLPAFGGDPQAITLLGHGTGAALANILVVSPVASDLVQHTVMVSGSALSPWAIQKNPLFVKRRVAEQTGCHGDMLYYDLAPCLRTKSLTELLAVKIDHPRFLVGFAPFIDGTVISPNTNAIGKLSLPLGSAIVSTSGIEYANFPKRNLIFCLTSVESHLDLSAQDLEFGFNETRRDRILRTYVRNNFHYHLNEIFAVLKNEYTDWDKAIRSPLSSRDATLQFLSDGHTASSLIKLGYMHSLRGGRGYFLHFKHRTVEEEYPQRTGSVRGEDVPFWLGLPISPLFPHNYTTQEKQISHLMLRYLANFAKTGNPNQSSLSSPLPSPYSLIGGSPTSSSSSSATSSSSVSSSSNQAADDSHDKVKRSSFNTVNASTSSTSSGPIKSNTIVVDVATAAAREALNLAVLYNQRRTKRTYYKRHSRSNDDHSGSASNEVNYFLSINNNNNINKLDNDELPFWDAYDVVNQLYMELGNKAEIQSHYRGHKLSMWLNLIPQLHRHANMNDQSMRHHQFQDDLNNLNLYEGIVRAQLQTKPDDDDETLLLPKGRPTPPPPPQETNTTQKPNGGTTECGVDGAMFVAEMTTVPPSDNRSLVLDSREKEMATASTGLIGNLEVLRRLSGKQFQSYTTALVATVAVGCFLLILNILIFAGIYHQREKRARDAKTKEELQDNDTSKNSSMLKLNALGSETGSFNGSGAGVSGKTTVVFGEYNCYDEKSLQTKDEKLIVELPPPQMIDPNWAACSTSTLDLLKTKHHTPLDTTYALSNIVPINTESQTEHLIAVNAMEMATYNPMTTGLIIDPSLAATSSSGLLSKRGSFVGSAGQLNQYDFASVQSSDQMSFKDIENAVKASATMDDDITQDDDIPEPPPPPRSFHSMQQHQLQQQQLQQQQQHSATNAATGASGSGGGGILRQAGTTSATQTGGGKKRVHIQEISV